MGVLVELYADSLSEFYEKVKHLKHFDMHTVLFISGYKVGYHYQVDTQEADIQEEITKFKKYLSELMKKNSIHEDFLIMGLVREITDWLNQLRYGLADNISMFLSVLDEKENADKHDLCRERLAVFTSFEYRLGIDTQIDEWSQIIAKNFTIANRREYDYQQHKKISDSLSQLITSYATPR